MRTVTIKLPEFLDDSLEAAAVGAKQSKSAVVRDLLLKALPAATPGPAARRARPSLHDRLKQYQGAGPTGVKDLASNPRHLDGYGRE